MQISLIYIVYTVHEKILGFLAGTFLCRTLYSDEKKDDDDVNDVRVCGTETRRVISRTDDHPDIGRRDGRDREGCSQNTSGFPWLLGSVPSQAHQVTDSPSTN